MPKGLQDRLPTRVSLPRWLGLGLTACALLVAQAGQAESRSKKGYYNGEDASCNFVASAKGWHVISSAFSGSGYGYSVWPKSANYVDLIYDPATPAGFKLEDRVGYERVWSQSRKEIKDYRTRLPTGPWPLNVTGSPIVGPGYTGDRPFFKLHVDHGATSMMVSVPPQFWKRSAPVGRDLTGVTDPFGRPFSAEPTLFAMGINRKNPILVSAQGVKAQTVYKSKSRGKQRFAYGRFADTWTYRMVLQTYTKSSHDLRDALQAGEEDVFVPSENYMALYKYLAMAQSPDDTLDIGVAHEGVFVFEQSYPHFGTAHDLFEQAMLHHSKMSGDSKCFTYK